MVERGIMLRRLIYWAMIIFLLGAACRASPTELELKQTPFATHAEMLAINVTARRLAGPTIDNVYWLEEGRVSTTVPGDGRLKLLAADRRELFVLEFETIYMTTGSDILRDEMFLTLVAPYNSDIHIVRLETPQGSHEVVLIEILDVSGN